MKPFTFISGRSPLITTVKHLVRQSFFALLLLGFTTVSPAQLTWDATVSTADGQTDGGGNWTISGSGNNHWWNGTTNVLWINGESAIFGVGGVAAGNVTIGSGSVGVTVNNITFNAPAGYTLTQGSTGRNITLTGGTITANTDATISAILTGSVGLTKAGTATLTLAGSTSYADTYSGTTTVNEGTLVLNKSAITANGGVSVPGSLIIGTNTTVRLSKNDQMITTANLNTATVTVHGTLDMNGFSDVIGALTGEGPVTLGAGTLSAGGNNPSTYSGEISGTGGLTKNGGGGTLTLTGASRYSGATTVSGGTLALSGAASINNSAIINVAAGATLDASFLGTVTLSLAAGQTLSGNGTVNGAAVVGDGATLAPGNNAIGTLTFNTTLALQAAGIATMELNKTTGLNDVAHALTNITYGGNLNVANVGGDQTGGETYKLFDAPNFTGAFANIVLPTLPLGLSWTNTLTVNGSIAVLGTVTPPPPSGLAITNTILSGTELIISGSGGTNGDTFSVWSAINVAAAFVNWSTLGGRDVRRRWEFFRDQHR